MGKLILELAMSADGFIAGPHDEISWLEQYDPDDYGFQEFLAETGAILMGHRSYEIGIEQGWFKNQAYGPSPIIVVCKQAPVNPSDDTEFHFVTTGIMDACSKAQELAGTKNVYVFGGASIVQQLLNKDLLDELHLGVVPVLLGRGIRLFDKLDDRHIQLECLKVERQAKGLVGLYYRVIK